MKTRVSKAAKVSLCRVCHGTGFVAGESKAERAVRRFLAGFRGAPEAGLRVCPQCGGSGRVLVSAEIELDIRPYPGGGTAPAPCELTGNEDRNVLAP